MKCIKGVVTFFLGWEIAWRCAPVDAPSVPDMALPQPAPGSPGLLCDMGAVPNSVHLRVGVSWPALRSCYLTVQGATLRAVKCWTDGQDGGGLLPGAHSCQCPSQQPGEFQTLVQSILQVGTLKLREAKQCIRGEHLEPVEEE